MSTLAHLQDLDIGSPITVGRFCAFPLLAREHNPATYAVLDEALADHLAQVTEVSDAGSVGQLRVTNSGKRPVLILDGEELVGAKQNRIVNLTILVAAESTLEIPVTCVEAGRWRHRSATFATAGRAHYASARAMKLSQVNCSMATDGSRRADQQAVWADIAAKTSRMGAHSDTQAAAAMYEQKGAALEEFVRSLTPVTAQVGAVFAIDGVIVGLEAFDSPSTWRKSAPKLAYSYGLDVLDRPDRVFRRAFRDPQVFIQAVACVDTQASPALGLGTDIRFGSADVVGAALLVDGWLVHAVAFPATA
jgi:ARG/rhodanese/phosphatase superfamily protein